ncbi:16S rRNA (uracil(1498)-N(3))-methyltransferase [Bacillus alkalicellulosilyticus]|uniref:16S rRNA (uracil(1498)-N(3))-methyltransferase n=1 Tax=Alkalihalobacterium alkalicellulosilyticum TaxID=1912214 RepID=UPI0009977B5D|nr:16S rRNA (uracil(1498)-N(3))-methyltransferase [Bacillus alkalicellulosilyticus]
MQRYFVDKMTEKEVIIVGDDVKHISRVMRMSIGDQMICSNNKDRVCRCEITDINQDTVKAVIVEELSSTSEMPIEVLIVQGLPKGDKLDLIIQKGTELGATSFIPFQAERSIVKWDQKKQAKKIERLEKIAKEAAEQSHRSIIPQVHSSLSLGEMIDKVKNVTCKIVAYEEEAKHQGKSRLHEAFETMKAGDSVVVVIGPEGGLSEKEINKLKDAGFICCSLGPRILRTETAPFYVLSALSYHFEIM